MGLPLKSRSGSSRAFGYPSPGSAVACNGAKQSAVAVASAATTSAPAPTAAPSAARRPRSSGGGGGGGGGGSAIRDRIDVHAPSRPLRVQLLGHTFVACLSSGVVFRR